MSKKQSRPRIELFDPPETPEEIGQNMLVRSVAVLAASLTYASKGGGPSTDQVLDLAQEFEDYIWEGRED